MISSILDLDTHQNQYFCDSGYSESPSPEASSTSSKIVYSPGSNYSDDVSSSSLRYLSLSDHNNENFHFDGYRLNPLKPEFQNQKYIPELIIVEQPVDKFRFRYKSEMHGTHGSLMGEKTEKSKRTYPTVELRNFNSKALIRCSLYQTDTLKRLPHSHKLVVRNGEDDQCDPHDLRVSPEEGFRAVFQGMGIIHTAKKYIVDELILKKVKERTFELGRALTTREESQIKISAEKEAKDMNLNQVCLAFHAYAFNNDGTLSKLCDPVFSRPINNMKSALTGELKIVRLSAVVSSAAGGEDLFLLVEKVGKKNIKVRFYEVDENDEVVWEDWGLFSEADVHHQYAIALRTPPYKQRDIDSDVHVFIELERPSDGLRSDPVPFKYKPRDFVMSRKRPRTSSSSLDSLELPIMLQCNSNNQKFYSQNRHVTLSEEFGKSEEINKLINYQQGQSNSGSNFEDYLSQVNMDSDELIKIMNPDLFETQGIEIDGTNNRKSHMVRQQQKRITHFNEASIMQQYFDKILTILRRSKSDLTKAAIEVVDVFKAVNQIHKDSLIHYAVREGNSKIAPKILRLIKELKIQDDVLNYQNEEKQTCLHIACLYDRPEYISALIQLGVNPNTPDIKGNTPLHIAIDNDFTMCATKIIESLCYTSNKLEINCCNYDGLTPLHLAIRKGNLQLVKKLIENGRASVKLSVQKDGNNPLHLAVQLNNEEIVKYLLESTSVDVNKKNLCGDTPLQLAQKMGVKANPIVQLIFRCGGINNDSHPPKMSSSMTDSTATTEDSSSEDDDIDEKLTIDENQKSYDTEEKILFDNLCIGQLASIFNPDEKWRLLADILNLNSYVCLWMSDDNPTEQMLKYISHHENGKLGIKQIIDACKKLQELDAVLCVEEMIKRQNKSSSSMFWENF